MLLGPAAWRLAVLCRLAGVGSCRARALAEEAVLEDHGTADTTCIQLHGSAGRVDILGGAGPVVPTASRPAPAGRGRAWGLGDDTSQGPAVRTADVATTSEMAPFEAHSSGMSASQATAALYVFGALLALATMVLVGALLLQLLPGSSQGQHQGGEATARREPGRRWSITRPRGSAPPGSPPPAPGAAADGHHGGCLAS
ncbi:unnamed protein product [Prorocentrum cordatum]|uniref:Uncharacterized protein n=1 Tax=Prorocentrum cordatum TaxID=2364126 RepID=A0ABN9TL46_9DINO|nr:unnamed protein product [Polarella glacialis]